jgi:hypothetical protein
MCEKIGDFGDNGSSFTRAGACNNESVFVVVANDSSLIFVQSIGRSVVADVVFEPALNNLDFAHIFKL